MQAWGAVHRSNDQLPYRVMSRLLNELQIRCTVHQLALFRGNADHSTMFLLVWRIALRAEGSDHISINAIASSLNRPYESVRRHVHELVRDGWLTLDDQGVTIAKSKSVAAALASIEAEMLVRLTAMLDGFVGVDIELPDPLLTRPLIGPAVIATVIDLQLLSIEHNNPQMPNVMMLNIMGAILILNVHEITYDPELSKRYSMPDQLPPMSLRKPVSLNMIAAMLSASYASVWRHVQTMIKNGVIIRVHGGYLVSPEWLLSPETLESSHAIIHHMRRALSALAVTLKQQNDSGGGKL